MWQGIFRKEHGKQALKLFHSHSVEMTKIVHPALSVVYRNLPQPFHLLVNTWNKCWKQVRKVMMEILVTELELEWLGIAFEVLKLCKGRIKGWNVCTEVTGTYLKIHQCFFISFYWNALISVQIWSGVTKHNPGSVTTFSRLPQSI